VSDCLFCKIVAGEIPAGVVLRADGFLAFHDINPVSIADVGELSDDERAAMGPFIARVAALAGVESDGYRVATNAGPNARQEIMHLHWHVLGGALLSQSM
jgi:histidine triad (HIT) family protein